MDFEQARFNMVEQQIRPWDVLDLRVLDLLSVVKREDFVPEALRNLAFVDTPLPLGNGAFLLPPRLEARLVQELRLQPTDRVLEIGTATGYITALLAKSSQQVYSVDINPDMTTQARRNLQKAGIGNATLSTGDGLLGLTANAPYNAIVLTGSVTAVPEALKAQLAIGGRLVAIVGHEPAMSLTIVTRVSETEYHTFKQVETNCPPLVGGTVAPAFVF